MTDVTAAGPAPAFAGFNVGRLQEYLKRSDLALAIGIMAILIVLILPLPRWLLDICLAFSLSFSILILMTAVFVRKPLEFSSFPTVLLITTMLRLSLNLASTRLILSHGTEGTAASGYVIQAFGKLIMQGNFVIGLIVFAILVLVNFVVITKGSGRIADIDEDVFGYILYAHNWWHSAHEFSSANERCNMQWLRERLLVQAQHI